MDYADDDEIRDGDPAAGPRPPASSPRRPAASPWPCCKKLVASGKLDPATETVVFNTGEGLKTLDAVAELVGPTYRIKPSLRGAREAGLLG